MSELDKPGPDKGGFVDFFVMAGARGQLATISGLRADAHADANMFSEYYVTPDENREHNLRNQLTSAQGALARWALMATQPAFRTVDLVRVVNDGDWDATSGAEEDIARIAAQLRSAGSGGDIIDRHSPEAKRRISVDPALVSAKGLVAVRRKRLMLATMPEVVEFADVRRTYGPGSRPIPEVTDTTAVIHLEVDKVSEFVLDIGAMREVNSRAADEVEAAIRGDAIHELTNHGRGLISPRLIEAAIDTRDPMLSPVATTYYAERKYRGVTKLVEPETELVA